MVPVTERVLWRDWLEGWRRAYDPAPWLGLAALVPVASRVIDELPCPAGKET